MSSNGQELLLMDNIETLFKCEPPITPLENGNGFNGVLLRNKASDTLQCHVCGGWYAALNFHIRKHNLTCDEYRDEYQLPNKFPLCSRAMSEAHSKTAKRPEILASLARHRDVDKARKSMPKKGSKRWKRIYRCLAKENMIGACPDQIRRRFMIVSDIVEREPTSDDIIRHDSALLPLIIDRFGSLNEFRKINGFTVRPQRIIVTDEQCLAAIRRFYAEEKRVPTAAEFRERNPTDKTIVNHLGSWNRAIAMAGFSPRSKLVGSYLRAK